MSGSLARDRMQGGRRGVLLCGAAAMAIGLAAAGSASAGGSLPTPTNTGAWANASASTSGATETVTVTSSRAYAEWSAFNLSSGNTLAVSGQTGANWILVNKVTGGTGTVIGGAVNAPGQVWIIDPNGVTVNAGAAFNVGGLLLSSAAWSDADKTNFLAGGTSWSFTGATQPIVLNGVVNASGGGVVALLGPSVTVGPTGAVSAGANTQFLAVAAKDVSLTFGDNGTYFTLDGVTIQRGANGGQVQISSGASISADRIVVASAGETSAASIVVAGGLTANAARADGSDIVLLAADGAGPDATPTAQTVLSSGAVPSWTAGASSTQGAVTLQTGAALQAAGVSIAAGGDISLGGDVTATSQASLYASTGAVAQTAGVVTTPLLTGSAATSVSLPDANLVGALSSFTAGSGLSFANAQALAVSGVSGGTGGVSLTAAGGGLTLSGNLSAGGAVSFGGPVALGTDATVSGSAVTFGSTLDGAHRLTVVSAGTTTFGGAVGAGTALSSLSVSGKSALDGGQVTTSGAQTFTGAVSLGANTTLSATTATFGSTVDGDRSLAIQGNAVLNGAVGASTKLASLSVSGTSALNGGSVRTYGTQTYTGAATLDANATLTGTTVTFGAMLDGSPLKPVVGLTSGGAATPGGSTILAGPTTTSGSTLGTVYGLAVNGNAVFSGAVGSVMPLSSLSVSGTTALAAGSVKTTGAQTYNGAATLGADAALAGSTVSFVSTLDGAHALAISGNGSFGGAVGAGTALTSLSVSGTSALNGGAVETTGTQSYAGAATLAADTTLTATAVTFGSTLDGARRLTVNGNGVFSGAVGSGTALASLSIGGTATLGGGPVTTTGTQTYTGAVTLDADATLAGSALSFGSTVDGGFGLTVNASGGAAFGGAVGGGAPLASLQATAGSISLAAPVQTSGALSLTSRSGLSIPVKLSSSGGDVTLAASGGDLALAADVDAVAGSLSLTASGAVTQTAGVLTAQNLSGSSVGGARLAQANRIGAIGSFANTGGGDVVFADAQDLGIGQVVNAGAASSVRIASTGSITQSGGGITAGQDLVLIAAGTLGLADAPSVGRDYTVTAASFSGLALAPAFAPGRDFTIDALGALSLPYAVSAPRNLTIQTQGDLTLGASATAGATLTLSSGGAIAQTGGALTAPTLTGSSAGTTDLSGPNQVGTLASFTTTAEGAGFTLSNAQALSVSGPVTAGAAGRGDLSLATTAGDLSLGGDLTASGGGTVSLTSAGAIGQTGGTITAGTLTGSAGASATLGQANAVGSLSGFTASTGLSFVDGTGFAASGVQGGTSISLTAGAGDLTLSGDVGATTVVLTASSGGISQSGGVIRAGTLGGSAATSVLLGDANLVQALSGFTAKAGLSFVDAQGFTAGGVVGGISTALTASTGDLTLSGDVSGTVVSLTASTGGVAQSGGVITAGTLSGSAGTSATLGQANAVGTLSGFTANSGLAFTNAAGFTAQGVDGGGATSLTATAGGLMLAGDIGGTTVTLSAPGGAITQTGGIITATTLSGSAGTSASLDDANAVQSLSGFTAAAGLSFTNGAGFTASAVSGGTSVSLTAGAGDLTLAGNVSGSTTTLTAMAGAIAQTGGIVTADTLSGSAGTSAGLDGANAVGALSGFSATTDLSFANAAGFTASGVAGGTSTSLTAKAGDLTLAGDVSGGTTTLTAAGAITQTGGAVTAATLTGSAGTSVSLGDANAVGTLSGFTAPGGIVFVNGAGFTAAGVDGGTSTSLTANAGDLILAGNVSGTTTRLTALTGSISQTGGIVAATTLTGSAGGGASLSQPNAVQTLSGFTAATGLAFVDAGGFSVAKVDGGAFTSLTAAGQLTLAGDVSGTRVALTASGGPIVQTGGTLTAGTLTGASVGATSLTDANLVGTLGAFTTYGPGADLTLVNAQTLTITGPLTVGATAPGGAAGVAEGNLTLTVTAGRLNLDGDLIAMADASGTGGELVLASAGGIASGDPPGITAQDISISSQSGSVSLGDLTATRDIAVSSATGSVAIDAARAGGNIVLRAPGDITVAGGLSATGAAVSAGPAQTLFASDPTMLGGVAFTLAGSNVDLKAGGSIRVGGGTTAATDVRLQAGGSIATADMTAGRDLYLDAAGAPAEAGQATVSTGALTATGRDVAVLAEDGAAVLGSASAGDDVALRGAASVTVVGGLTAGAAGGADAQGVADQLIGASPSNPIAFAGTIYSNLAAGADVDVKAGWTPAGVQSPGAAIRVGGPTSAGRDARFQATGDIVLGAVAAGQDVVADGASLDAGAISASGGDVALQASGGVKVASASAGDAIVVNAGGAASVSGALAAAGAGSGDGRVRAGAALADMILGLGPGQIAGDVVIAASDVLLGPISAATGEVLMFARSGAAGVTYLGGSGAGEAGAFHLDAAEISGITAHSLNVFAGLTSAGSGDVSIGALNLPQSLPTLRVYTGAASRVDVSGAVAGAAGSSLVIGDTQLRSELNAPSAAVLALSQGWTPKVIRVEGTIGGLGAGQAFNQVSLSAQSLYIAPVEPGLDFETAVKTVRPESLPVYTGPMTWQIAAANLQLSAAGPGVIYQRNLARNPSNLADGVGLSVGRITIATVTPSDAPPSQIALFGTLDPHGKLLNGLSAALSLTFPSQAGANAPVRFTPGPALIDRYKFSTCAFGGGDCFINIPPLVVPTVPVPNQIGDLSDPFAPTDEEPVTSSGGEITWPSVSGGDHHP